MLFGDVDAYLNGAHAADEAIEIADLVEMADFHRRLLMPPWLALPRSRLKRRLDPGPRVIRASDPWIQPDFAHKTGPVPPNLA